MFRRLPIAGLLLAIALALAVGATAAVAEPRPAAAPQPAVPPPRVRDPEPEPPRADEQVSSFTTRFTAGEPRVVNIGRAAALLDGTVLGPGQTFSMNAALGERTVDRGFVPAPMIFGGRLVDSVGGGISQVATAVYNAAFFAGLELVEHTPHSFYIDRYPMGREATISWGGPELVFRNDWPAPLRMVLSTTHTSLTVRFLSARLGRRVETETSQPYDRIGETGFTVEYTRRVYRFERLLRDERYRWRYQPKFEEIGLRRTGGT